MVKYWQNLLVVMVIGLLGVSLIACSTQLETQVAEEETLSTQKVNHRPIEDFVNQQGTLCIDSSFNVIEPLPDRSNCFLFVPPIENFIGSSDPKRLKLASIDYAGLANKWVEDNSDLTLGTTFSGGITERPLKDGRFEVFVKLKTYNALTWVTGVTDLGFNGPLLFGHRAPDVVGGAEPAFCDSLFEIKFTVNYKDEPLPDILQLFIDPEAGQEVTQIKVECNALGPLHENEDEGWEEGTLGRAKINQRALFHPPVPDLVPDSKPEDKGVWDGFPVENIILHPLED